MGWGEKKLERGKGKEILALKYEKFRGLELEKAHVTFLGGCYPPPPRPHLTLAPCKWQRLRLYFFAYCEQRETGSSLL